MKINMILMILGVLFGNPIKAADDSGTQEKHEDQCVQSCINYYDKNQKLDGFTYYEGDFNSRNDKTISKLSYCTNAQQSLTTCYSQDNALYGQCKATARWLASFITTHQGIQDWLSSCKATCQADLTAFCGKPDDTDIAPDKPQELAPQDTPPTWLKNINRQDIYKVIFSGLPFRTQEMSGQEILDLSTSDQRSISKVIPLDRITLTNGQHVYVHPETTYAVVYNGDYDNAVTDNLLGKNITNSPLRFSSITKR